MDPKKFILICVICAAVALAVFLGFIMVDVAFKLGLSSSTIPLNG